MSILNEAFTLSNGVEIPKLALGTYLIKDEAADDAVATAIDVGYRHIDTAVTYENEEGVGRGIKKSGLPREKLFVTSKVPFDTKTYEGAVKDIDDSLRRLDLEYLDLCLIHGPKPLAELFNGSTNMYFKENLDVWRALTEAQKVGKIRAIGVSNFEIPDIENILENSDIKPVVNQIRFQIGRTSDELTAYCQANDILVEGFSPMGTGAAFKNELVADMAEKYGVSVSQLCLRYVVQRGVLPLPKATSRAHMIQNAELDFVISDSDMEFLNSQKEIFVFDPSAFLD